MLNAKEMNNLQKDSNVFVLHRVLRTKAQFVVVMAELTLTAKCCKESHA